MTERDPADPTLPVPCAVLQALLSAVPTGAEAELRSAGHDTGIALARRISESGSDSSPSWEAISVAWQDLGLGRLSRTVPGPGLLEIVNEESGLPSGAPEFGQGLLEGLIEGFVSEPVRVMLTSVADSNDDSVADGVARFVVGAPELIARLEAGRHSGRSIGDLMEEVWS